MSPERPTELRHRDIDHRSRWCIHGAATTIRTENRPLARVWLAARRAHSYGRAGRVTATTNTHAETTLRGSRRAMRPRPGAPYDRPRRRLLVTPPSRFSRSRCRTGTSSSADRLRTAVITVQPRSSGRHRPSFTSMPLIHRIVQLAYRRFRQFGDRSADAIARRPQNRASAPCALEKR